MSDLSEQFDYLWNALAGSPNHRALVVARMVANHAAPDSELIKRAREQIRRCTPDGAEKREALQLLTRPALSLPQIVVDRVRDERTLRADPELARLAVALHLSSAYRLYVIGRDVTRRGGGSGWITRAQLHETLASLGVGFSRRHVNRLLRTGSRVFWNLAGDRIYLHSWSRTSRDLSRLASPALVQTNRPGVRDIYLPASGSPSRWEAMIYAGWMAHREDPTISREVLERLFNRDQATLRRWEQTRLGHILTIRKNYAQVGDVERFPGCPPEHAQPYVTRRGETRIYWRMPNSYQISGIRQHAHKGQARKVRQSVNDELRRPADDWHGGMHCSKLYFDQYKKLKWYLKRHGGIRYLWRGPNRHGHGIFEPTADGAVVTHGQERAGFQQERAVFQRLAERRRAYLGGI